MFLYRKSKEKVPCTNSYIKSTVLNLPHTFLCTKKVRFELFIKMRSTKSYFFLNEDVRKSYFTRVLIKSTNKSTQQKYQKKLRKPYIIRTIVPKHQKYQIYENCKLKRTIVPSVPKVSNVRKPYIFWTKTIHYKGHSTKYTK